MVSFFLLLFYCCFFVFFFFSSRRRHTRSLCDWSSDVCSSDLLRDGGDRHRELHAAECLQGVDHRIEAPWLCLLEQLGLQAMQKLGAFGDGPNVLLEDDLLGRGGQHEASEPADMFGPPVRAADVADVV